MIGGSLVFSTFRLISDLRVSALEELSESKMTL